MTDQDDAAAAEAGTTNDDDAVMLADDDVLPGYGWTASEEGISFYLVVFLSMLALVLVLCKLLLRNRPRIASFLPEAGLTIIVGTLASYIIHLLAPAKEASDDVDDAAANGVLTFSSTTFFVALLPPIIFNSGYQLKMELFLEDFKAIASFACIGTAISTFVVSFILQIMVGAGLTDFTPSFTELLTFGALISATDPVSTLAVFQTRKVDPRLFYLVFGESVLNDAVGLVLFNALSKFVGHEKSFEKVTVALLAFVIDFSIVSIGSLCLGVLCGLVAGLVLKKVDMRSTWLLELSLYMLIMYLPFFLAEILHLSGIVTILFSGISAKRYAEPNLSRTTKNQADALFRVTAHLAETAIFLELGLSVFGLDSRGNFHIRFILCAMFACLVGRLANVYPIASVLNRLLDIKYRNSQYSNDDGEQSSTEAPSGGYTREEDGAASNGGGINISERKDMLGQHDLKIESNTCHMLWFSGLRGAVAYACAKTFPDANGHRTSFCITTMVIVLITTFLFGGTTEIALDVLNIDVDVNEEDYMRETGGKRGGIIQTFEDRYIYPCVIRDYGNNVSVEDIGDDLLLHADGGNASTDNQSETSTNTGNIRSKERGDGSSLAAAAAAAAAVEPSSSVSAATRKEKSSKSLYDYGMRK